MLGFLANTAFMQHDDHHPEKGNMMEMLSDPDMRTMVMEHISEHPEMRREMMKHMMGSMDEMGHHGMMEGEGMDHATMMEMMQDCPMMEDKEMNHSEMMEMMEECPMMAMMQNCPMMKGGDGEKSDTGSHDHHH